MSETVRKVIPPDAFTSSRVKYAAEQLAEFVRRVEPGDRIGKKDEVRRQVGVSQGTFNEALRLLQSEGLITLKSGPHGGLFAAQQSPIAKFGSAVLQLDDDVSLVSEAVRIRMALESLVVQDAVGVSSPALIAEMREQLGAMRQAVEAEGQGLEFVHANWRLHHVIARASTHPMLQALYTNLLDFIEGHTVSVVMVADVPMRSFHHDRYLVHRDLVDAIAADDMAAAMSAVQRHNAGLAEANRLSTD